MLTDHTETFEVHGTTWCSNLKYHILLFFLLLKFRARLSIVVEHLPSLNHHMIKSSQNVRTDQVGNLCLKGKQLSPLIEPQQKLMSPEPITTHTKTGYNLELREANDPLHLKTFINNFRDLLFLNNDNLEKKFLQMKICYTLLTLLVLKVNNI